MSRPNCEICPFTSTQQADDREVLLQTSRWNVVLDRNQEYLGKSFVSLREHKGSLSELDTIDWTELREVIRRIEAAMAAAFRPDVFNWSCLMNNAVVASQPTHVHWHLHPRFLHGTEFAGVSFPNPKWPRRVEKLTNIVDDAVFDAIVAAVRQELAR